MGENACMKLYLGCAMPPFHSQHYALCPDLDSFTWVDKYVKHPNIKNWDVSDLKEVKDGSVETIYTSHLLEHLPHPQIPNILDVWFKKLRDGGNILVNVPDMRWVAEQVIKYCNGEKIDSGHYTEWEGEHGMQQIIYGSHAHDGEVHKSGFTQETIYKLFEKAGFKDIKTERIFEAHDMGCIILKATK